MNKNSRYIISRAAFTLTELVVVISVIAVLAGVGIPIYGVIVKQQKITVTRAMVELVSQQIMAYGVKRWTWTDPVQSARQNKAIMYSGNIFALKEPGQSVNGSNERIPFPTIDGRPAPPVKTARAAEAVYDGPFINQETLINSGYLGFFDMVGAPIDKQFVNAKHQIVDAWKEPLRIVYAANAYGTRGFGIWSPGPDKIDQELDPLSPKDDIRSWEGVDTPASAKGKKP